MRWLASAHTQAGNSSAARELHAESVALNEQTAGPLALARALRVAGEDELELGDAPRAVELIESALALVRSGGHEREVVMALHSLGDAYLVSGDTARARRSYVEALAHGGDAMTVTDSAHCLAGLAAVAAREQRPEISARLWNAVAAYERDVGGRLIYPHARRRYAAEVRPDEANGFAEAVDEEGELTLEGATALALDALGEPPG